MVHVIRLVAKSQGKLGYPCFSWKGNDRVSKLNTTDKIQNISTGLHSLMGSPGLATTVALEEEDSGISQQPSEKREQSGPSWA